jgi:hypothetical protein
MYNISHTSNHGSQQNTVPANFTTANYFCSTHLIRSVITVLEEVIIIICFWTSSSILDIMFFVTRGKLDTSNTQMRMLAHFLA